MTRGKRAKKWEAGRILRAFDPLDVAIAAHGIIWSLTANIP
jgi:hypothetical protein